MASPLQWMKEAFGYRGRVEIKGEVPEFTSMNTAGGLWELVELHRKVIYDRRTIFNEIERMCNDSVVNSAVEMMVEDATQFDMARNHIVWVECEDNPDLEKDLNEFLWNELDIEDRIFNWGYKVVQNGEVFLKTYETERKRLKEKLEEYKTRTISEGVVNKGPEAQPLTKGEEEDSEILESSEYYEEVEDPIKVMHLTRYGKTVGFFQQNERDESGVLYPPDDFVHIISDRGHRRSEFKLRVKADAASTNESEDRVYKVKFGTSFLQGALQAYAIVHLLEDVMVLSRISRSSFFRLFNVNVGTAGKTETVKILKEVRNAIRSRERINTTTGYYKSDSNPIPMNDSIFIPTRGGKGEISVDTVGGDVDVKSMVDFDFFWNKLCGGLRVPKAFLGFEESLPGGIGNTSLTRLDIRYARTVKRLVSTLKSGVRDVLNNHLRRLGKEELIDDFEVCMAHINDAEESDRVADLGGKADAANNIINSLSSALGIDGREISKSALIEFILKDIMGIDPTKFKPTPEDIAKAEAEDAAMAASTEPGSTTPMGGGPGGEEPGAETGTEPELPTDEIPASPDLSKVTQVGLG